MSEETKKRVRRSAEEIAAEIDKEVKKIVDERYAIAKNLLLQNEDMLRKIARELLERETLDDNEFAEIMDKIKAQRGENQA